MREFEIINENLRQALASFSFTRPSGVVRLAHGLSMVSAGVPHSLFNTALITAPVPGETGPFFHLLQHAGAFFEERQLPWSIWFCESLFETAERRVARLALAANELKIMMDTPGMIADELAPPRRTLPRMLYQRVASEDTRRDFSSIMSASFSVPRDMSEDVYGGPGLWSGPLTGWVGYVAGEAIATACTIPSAGAVGLYAVGTMPRYQRHGYGEAVVRHAIEWAQGMTGLSRIVLQSSSSGYPLYIAMGFRNVTRFSVYIKG
ncbi:MAG: GNAT family N-acetyltransferase [Acidobacteria bacterium]|nr:GNAT family N-acetyltransferase [Acidobacteriota bacterium]